MKFRNLFSFQGVIPCFLFLTLVRFSTSETFIYEETFFLDGRRYRISSKKLNYTDAARECERDGSKLAVVNSIEIFREVYQGLERSSLQGAGNEDLNVVNEGVWIGLRLDWNNQTLGTWADESSYNVDDSYSNWAPSEPQGQACVQLWKAYLWKWDDTYCDLRRSFICEDSDPHSFTKRKVDELTEDILKLSDYTLPTPEVVNQMSLDADRLLDVSDLRALLSDRDANDILLAIEKISDNFNASWKNTTVYRRNIAIDLLGQISGDADIVFGQNAQKYNFEKTASIHLTKSLLEEARIKAGRQDLEISSVSYRVPSLFPSPTDDQEALFSEDSFRTSNLTVLGNVISVDVKNVPMRHLHSPVIINHVLNLSHNLDYEAYFNSSCFDGDSCPNQRTENFESLNIRRVSSFQCVHWDFSSRPSSGDWSPKGCHLHSFTVSNGIVNISCRCNHMTNFAVILNTSEFFEPAYLSGLTITSCVIAIVCLSITLITHLLFKQLRKKPLQQILIHICLGLIILNSFFLIGIDRTEQTVFCFATAIILHYSVLLSWNWMLLEGIYLFRTFALYKAGSGPGSKLSPLITSICYVFPGISVAVCAGVLQKSYLSPRYCWLSVDVLTYSIVAPVGAVLCINFVIFAVVMWNISLKSRRFQKRWDVKSVGENLRRAFYMTVVLGLPWVFGYLMLLSNNNQVKDVFSIIFTISNAIQAIGIVFLFCLRHENVRNLWTTSTMRSYRRTVVRLRGSTKRTIRTNQTYDTKSCQTFAQTYNKKSTSDNSTAPPSSSDRDLPRYVRTPHIQNY